MTITIIGHDPNTGQFGGLVVTKNPAVGSRVLRGMGEVGMMGSSGVETQRRRAIALLMLGFPAKEAMDALKSVSNDQGAYCLLDRVGTPAVWVSPGYGSGNAGERIGPNYACYAGTKYGPDVANAFGDTFEATEGSGLPLEERLIRCHEAADEVGGDSRGRQAAAIQIHWKRSDANPFLDVRVDEHHNAIAELRAAVKAYRMIYPQYHDRTWPDLQGTGGFPILYPNMI